MPWGGKRLGAGRPRALADDEREEIAREYRQRMWAWAAVRVIKRSPNLQKRREFDERMREKAKTHMVADDPSEEGYIRFQPKLRLEMEKIQAKIDAIDNRPKISLLKRAKGPAKSVIEKLAEEYGITKRMVIRCIYES